MTISYEEARDLKRELEDDYADRHDQFRRLRNYWHGRYWEDLDAQTKTISTLFKDITASATDVGPDFKLVNNIVQQVCVKYQSFLSPLPQIHVYVDPPESEKKRAKATMKQRFLYGAWSASMMSRHFNQHGWFLPLMGSSFLGVHPDFDRKLPVAMTRSPEYAYPIMGFDGNDMVGTIFSWKAKEKAVMREFDKYVPRADRRGFVGRALNRDGAKDEVEVLEYSDKNCWYRWVDNQKMEGEEHNFGFNLWQHLKFIDVPGEPWGHGAVEQVVGLNEAENVLQSLLLQAVMENVFPQLVLIDPSKAPEEIEKGPGSVLPINQGGDAKYLTPPTANTAMTAQMIQQTEHSIKQGGSMPETQFGGSPVSSILTGKAVEELQGAGTGSLVEMVQSVGIGQGIVNWNESALYIARELFADDTINLFGTEVSPHAIKPRSFSDTIKGRQLTGSSRNEVMFSPALNQHEKLVMWLQAKGGGLVSNKYIRDQIGIPDSQAMDEQIFQEAIEQGVLGAILMELQQQPTPETAEQTEQKAYAYMQGAAGPPPSVGGPSVAPPGLPPGLPAPGGAIPGAPPSPGGAPAPGGPGGAPPMMAPPVGPGPQAQTPPGPAATAGQGAPAPEPSAQATTVEEAQAAFQAVQGLTGRVFLTGEIVQRGETANDIEVAITNQPDQQILIDGLPQYQGRLVFHLVSHEPSEPHLEVTPGAPAQRGGSEQANPEALRGVFVG